jgi:hypothetical protein
MPEKVTLAQYQYLSRLVEDDRWPAQFNGNFITKRQALDMMDDFENDANTAFDLAADADADKE